MPKCVIICHKHYTQIIGLHYSVLLYISYSVSALRKCVRLEATLANILLNCCQSISCVSDGLETNVLETSCVL